MFSTYSQKKKKVYMCVKKERGTERERAREGERAQERATQNVNYIRIKSHTQKGEKKIQSNV